LDRAENGQLVEGELAILAEVQVTLVNGRVSWWILLPVALFLVEFAMQGTIHMLSVFPPLQKVSLMWATPERRKKGGSGIPNYDL